METEEKRWYVMRDLKRANARERAYQALTTLGFEVFTPMKDVVEEKGGKRMRRRVPAIPDLLFVKSHRYKLDPIVKKESTLQYRFVKGGLYQQPMEVPMAEMERFIAAVSEPTRLTTYYAADAITPGMLGRRVRIQSDGPLNTFEGHLLKIRGTRNKRLLIKLEGLLSATIELTPTDRLEFL